ncbi:MAG: helix-turn-helix domain-containing protein [Lachnospiraceae bacterium]
MKSFKDFTSHYHKQLKESSFFKRVLAFYIIVSSLMFFLFSILNTSSINKSYFKNIISLHTTALSQASSVTTNILGNIYAYSYKIFTDDATLLGLMTADSFDSNLSFQSSQLLSDLSNYNNLISSCYIINRKADFVCSTNNPISTINSFYDKDIMKRLKDRNSNQFFIPRSVDDKLYISLIFVLSRDSAFVVNIDQIGYSSMVNNGHDSDFRTIILNNSNEVISDSESKLYADNLTKNSLITSIETKTANNGNLVHNIQGDRYYITYIKNDFYGFSYLTMTRKYFLYLNNPLLIMALSLSLLFILITLLLSIILSWLTYNPVHKLVKQATNYDKSNAAKYLKRIIEGHSTNLPIQGNNVPHINLPGPCYQTVIISFDDMIKINQNNDDINLLKYSINNIGNELLEKDYAFESIDYAPNRIIYIISIDPSFDNNLEHLFHELQMRMANYFQVTISVSFGSIVEKPEDIHLSYRLAANAIQYKLVMGNQSLIHYEELTFEATDKQYYPYEAEKEILHAIKTGQEAEAHQGVESFINTLAKYHYNQIILYVLQLNALLERHEYALKMTTFTNEKLDMLAFESLTLDEIRSILKNRIHVIIRISMEEKQNSKNKASLVERIHEFIDENIFNTNLSAELVAQEVNLSVNYLRNIYKQNTGESITNYITAKRVEYICSLLVDTDMPIQEISDKLGFNTKNYFFTFFKKHTGTTPNQYRKEHSRLHTLSGK